MPDLSLLDRSGPVAAWLLDGDPAIRWQVLQDLLDAPAAEVAAARARVATEGVGALLLAAQRPDGTWGGIAWNPGSDSTMHALVLLADFGLDPDCPEARRALSRVREQVTWYAAGPPECDDHRYFEGELEPCINGQVALGAAYFGEDVRGIVQRLVGEQLEDGGWNCETINGSRRASFNTTICVLEALLAFEQRFDATPEVTAARRRGEEYLLERRLMRRLSTGEVIHSDRMKKPTPPDAPPAFARFAFPTWWHYDVLRGLDHFRRGGGAPDARLDEAVELVRSRRGADGRWALDVEHPGRLPVEIGEAAGQPSRWITLRALRVLKWFDAGR